jgi:hypothetical protein
MNPVTMPAVAMPRPPSAPFDWSIWFFEMKPVIMAPMEATIGRIVKPAIPITNEATASPLFGGAGCG